MSNMTTDDIMADVASLSSFNDIHDDVKLNLWQTKYNVSIATTINM